MIGQFTGSFEIDLPAHGTRVFFVHKQNGNPQLIGTNRHVSGAFSIRENVWNDSQMALNGISETVPGAKYSLYYYIPKNTKIDKVDVDTQDVTQKLHDNGLLEVSFMGREKPVTWNLKFTRQ